MLKRLWKALRSTVLWNHRRGSWQYDLIVAAILAFIFLTPRTFFGDQPRPPVVQEITQLSDSGGELVYWIDASIVEGVAEDEIRPILVRLIKKRRGLDLDIVDARPETGPSGAVEGYLVYARP